MSANESEIKGLARAKETYLNRDRRAKELKAEGKKIVGYLCCFPPLEMLTAVDMVPYRILGNAREPITVADNYLETIMCPFLRSCFDMAFKGQYDFLDGFVAPHGCDAESFAYSIWRYYFKPSFSHFVHSPHFVHPPSIKFFKEELGRFKRGIEKFIGRELSDQSLRQAILLHNQNRALVRELYELRKPDPPLLSGSEVTQILVAAMSIPVIESNELLREVIEEVRERKDGPEKKHARLLIWGGPIDDIAFIELVEECGANVVMDDMCIGTRFYWPDVEMTQDTLDGLTKRYLVDILCPRTFREFAGTHKADLENRFSYLKDFAKGWNVNSVILQVVRACDSHEYEVPDVKDYLREAGLTVIDIEHDYLVTALQPLKTRIQALVEMVG